MEYRRLGRSGLTISEISLGCGNNTFAGRADEQTSIDLINHALGLGINYLDTGATYAEGRSEALIGKALKGKRSQAIIGTRFGTSRSVGPSEQRGSRNRMMKAVEGSLQRLDTEYIDLYIMHEPDPGTPIEETLRALDDLVRAGKVRYIACCRFAAWQLCDALWTSKAQNLESFIATYMNYSLLNRKIERELVPYCETVGVGIVPVSPLADGFLTGKYRRGQEMPKGTRFTSIPRFAGPKHQDLGRYNKILSEANFDKLEKLETFAKERGHGVGELAVAWLLSHSWLGTVPVGVTNIDQLKHNVAGSGWKLTGEDIVQLGKIL